MPVYSESSVLNEGEDITLFLRTLIDETITRFTSRPELHKYLFNLQFPTELEAVYELDTKNSRILELRGTVLASIVLMVCITVTDKTFVPDIGWNGLLIRLIASVFLGAATMIFHRVSALQRELLLSLVAYIAVVALISIPLLSKATEAPIGLFVWMFGLIYCNTTTRLRFKSALPFSVVCVSTAITLTCVSGRISADLADSLTFLAVVGAAFSLIANYRMERSIRLSYLLASREALRLLVLKRSCNELETRSSMDALTRLYNRGHFDRSLDMLFAGSENQGDAVSLLIIDVDYFKRYNDCYGHPAGDSCLKSIAAILTEVLRGTKGFGFRYGGEEFGALLLDVSGGTAASIAERVRASVELNQIQHSNRGDDLNVVTISVGVASTKIGHGGTAKELIGRADASLYTAKNKGRNQTVFMQLDVH